MKKLFESQCSIAQICQNCLVHTSSTSRVLSDDNCNICNCFCRECFEMETIRNDCKIKGQVSTLPSLRACEKCLDAGIKCYKNAVLVVTVDCEEGNKQAMVSISNKVENLLLKLLVPLPDSVHVGKSLKASFANWYLKFDNERGNLSILGMLQNKASHPVKEAMRKLLSQNDHTKNKDRQDPKAVLRLTDTKLTSYISSLGFVGHTIIPESVRFTESNKIGVYPCPISIAVGPYGSLIFLCLDTQSESSIPYIAQLHNPIMKITLLEKGLSAKEVHYHDKLIFLVGKKGPIAIHELENGIVSVDAKKLQTRAQAIEKMSELHLPVRGTVKEMKTNLTEFIDDLKEEYKAKGYAKNTVNLEF